MVCLGGNTLIRRGRRIGPFTRDIFEDVCLVVTLYIEFKMFFVVSTHDQRVEECNLRLDSRIILIAVILTLFQL